MIQWGLEYKKMVTTQVSCHKGAKPALVRRDWCRLSNLILHKEEATELSPWKPGLGQGHQDYIFNKLIHVILDLKRKQ